MRSSDAEWRSAGINVAIADIGEQFLGPAQEKLAEAAAEAGVSTFGGVCDVTSEASVQQFADEVAAAFPGLPISFLACNAGVVGGGSGVVFSSHEEWMKMLGPNTCKTATLSRFAALRRCPSR